MGERLPYRPLVTGGELRRGERVEVVDGTQVRAAESAGGIGADAVLCMDDVVRGVGAPLGLQR